MAGPVGYVPAMGDVVIYHWALLGRQFDCPAMVLAVSGTVCTLAPFTPDGASGHAVLTNVTQGTAGGQYSQKP